MNFSPPLLGLIALLFCVLDLTSSEPAISGVSRYNFGVKGWRDCVQMQQRHSGADSWAGYCLPESQPEGCDSGAWQGPQAQQQYLPNCVPPPAEQHQPADKNGVEVNTVDY